MCTLTKVVDTYQEIFDPNYKQSLERYCDFLNEAVYCDEVMAEVLLIGNHQARLNDIKSWRVDVCHAINKLAKAKPWTNSYVNFDDIYNDVQCLFYGCKYIGGLAIYDVTLRLAARFNDNEMMPKKVYLNAGPLEAAKKLLGTHKMDSIGHIVDREEFPQEFHDLRCDQIEELLCIMERYGVFSNLDSINNIKPNSCSCFTNCSFLFRRNLLAHRLLDENWDKEPIPYEQLETLAKRLEKSL